MALRSPLARVKETFGGKDKLPPGHVADHQRWRFQVSPIG